MGRRCNRSKSRLEPSRASGTRDRQQECGLTTEKKATKSATPKRGSAEPLNREQVLERYAETGYALDEHPAHVIRKAHQRATLRFQQVMAGEDLSPTQFAALATILKHGEVSQNHLGRLTAMDPSTISIVMRKLLKHELITR